MKKLSVIFLILITAVSMSLFAGLSGSLAFKTSYVWRGMDFYPKGKPALQPSLTYAFGNSGFSLTWFTSYAMTDRNDLKYLEESDLTLDYTFNPAQNITLSLGMSNYGYYWIPNYTGKDGNSQEFYAIATFTDLPLSPKVSVYYDINLGDGIYISLGGSHSFKLTDELNLDLSGEIGYNGSQWTTDSGFSDINFIASTTIPAGKFTVTPAVFCTFVLMDSLKNPDGDSVRVWAGLTIGF